MQWSSSSSADPEAASSSCAPNSIGVAGRFARLAVGLAFIGLALFWRNPDWEDFVLGLVVAPLLVVGLLAFRAHRVRRPLRATGLLGHAANLVILIPLFALPATAGAAFLFYGASMLFAAARAAGTCEVTAISNAVLGRDDQIGCPLFWPVDAAEARFAGDSDRVVEGR